MRDATLEDLAGIVDIYNSTIPGRIVSADTEPVSVEQRLPWFHEHDPARRPIWVAEANGEVVSWLSLSDFYDGRPAYNGTAEIGIYVREDHRGEGIGGRMLQEVIGRAPALGIKTLTAGAFAAFLATSSGLTIAVAGVITQDVISKRVEGVTAFRLSAVVAVVVPFVLALVARDVAVATVVGLAFAMAAATFCPLLVLGIWWRGLTDVGALIGLLVGGGLTGGAVVDNLMADRTGGWFAAVVEQPAACAVPLAFATMVVVSRLTRRRLPAHTSRFMVRLHTPETVPLDRG